MKEYEIAVILWEDHYHSTMGPLPETIDEITPTLTVGIILEETEKALLIAHDIEKYADRDEVAYSVILKNSIVSREKFGKIPLTKLRK